MTLSIGYTVFIKRKRIAMGLPNQVECNKIIDQVIESRRTIKNFELEFYVYYLNQR